MTINFKQPSRGLLGLVYGAGLLTAFIGTTILESVSDDIYRKEAPDVATQTTLPVPPKPQASLETTPNPRFAREDAASLILPGDRIHAQPVATQSASIRAEPLNKAETALARQAWQYFEKNLNPQTGLVNSVDQFASVTLWDQSAAMAAVVSAKELHLISPEAFKTKMSLMLGTLAKLPLYKGELPNKVYNAATLIPVGYGQLNTKAEIGWSAIDVGRISLWLKLIGTKYPEFKSQTETIWKSWQIDRLVKDGQMYGTQITPKGESYNQEGRLGYENYGAYGLRLWGLNVSKALDFENKTAFAKIYGHNVAFDIRDRANSKANNYVLSEPYFLDGIETGFQSLPKIYADGILAAQEARYNATGQLTALTEDNLDQKPYFVYNTIFVNGNAWSTINDHGDEYNYLRFLSAKAAIGWHVLYRTKYTQKLFNFTQEKMQNEGGIYSGYYETLNKPNAILTANNNGIILEALFYKAIGKPLVEWAGVSQK